MTTPPTLPTFKKPSPHTRMAVRWTTRNQIKTWAAQRGVSIVDALEIAADRLYKLSDSDAEELCELKQVEKRILSRPRRKSQMNSGNSQSKRKHQQKKS